MIIRADLERDQRVVVEALAILVWDATRTDLVALLRARGLRGASGKVFSSSVLGIILEELVGLGIIRSAASPSLELPVRDAVVEELRREGTLEGWLDVLPLAFPLSRLSGSVAERLERWRVHADLRRGHTDISPRWTSSTGRARLADLLLAPSGEGIDAFPPASRPLLLSCALTRAFARWLDVSPLLDLARAHASAPQISVPLACVEMCRGELARAERCLEASAPSVERAEARALLALFRGDRASAVAAFEGAATAVRKRSPTRALHLDPPFDALWALAEARSGDARAVGLVGSVVVRGALLARSSWWALEHALACCDPRYPWEALSVLLACGYGGAAADRAVEEKLEKLTARARDARFAQLALECEAVRAVFAGGECAPGLCAALRPAPAWEAKLLALAALVPEATPSAPSEEAGRAERLAFIVRVVHGHAEIEPRLQKRKRAGWSVGRKIALERLVDAPPIALTPEDRAVVRTIRVETERNYRGYVETFSYFDDGAFEALAAHPHTLREDGTPIKIRVTTPALEVREEGDAKMLEVVPATPGAFDRVEYVEIIRFDETMSEIAELIGPRGLRVPRSGADALAATLAKLTRLVPVMSDARAAVALEEEPADATLRVRLRREATLALRYEVRVTPLGAAGPAHPPGLGPAGLAADGRAVARDLPAERAALDALFERCPALERKHEGAREGERCLALLEELKSADALLEWPEGEPLRARTVRAGDVRVSFGGAAEWLSVEGGLTIDGALVIEMRALLAHAREEAGYLVLPDGEVAVLERSLRRELATLAAFGDPTLERVHQTSLLVLDELELTPKLTRSLAKRREEIRRVLREAVELPSTLEVELRAYQREGFEWLARRATLGIGACLADDMGLGKTVQALALLSARAPEGPGLVVAPTSVVHGWVEQALRFAPSLRLLTLDASTAREARDRMVRDAAPFDVLVTSWSLLARESDLLSSVTWHTAVLDEAQAIKNPRTSRALAACALRANARVAMSGTPVENGVRELHSLFRFLHPGLFGSADTFERMFAAPIERGDVSARAALRARVAPLILRRTKGEVLAELPPRIDMRLDVVPSEEHAALLEAIRLEGLAKVKRAGRRDARMQVLAALTRLRLACCHPRLVVEDEGIASAKTEAFLELVSELREGGHRALVFSQFVKHLELVRAELDARGIRYQYLDGSSSQRARQSAVHAFQRGEGELFLISLKAGGTGLNLTAADYVIHLDPWWNPAVEDQASDRAHRIGQTRPVTVYRLVLEGSVEQRILELHAKKRELADALVTGGGELDLDALVSLLS